MSSFVPSHVKQQKKKEAEEASNIDYFDAQNFDQLYNDFLDTCSLIRKEIRLEQERKQGKEKNVPTNNGYAASQKEIFMPADISSQPHKKDIFEDIF